MNFQETLFPGYTIGEDAYQNIPAVCAPFGKKAAIIGGKRALAAAEEKKTRYQWRLATVTEFKAENPSLTHYSVNQIGRVLDRMGFSMERRRANGKQHRMRRLPMRKPYDSVST